MLSESNKIARALLISVLLLALLMVLKNFFIPLAYGLLLALILYPVCRKLEDRGAPPALAIFIALLILLVLAGIIVGVFIWQLKSLQQDLPQLSEKISTLFADAQQWMYTRFGMSYSEQDKIAGDLGKNFDLGAFLKGSFTLAAGTVFVIIIVPVYTVLILAYRRVLVEFAASALGSRHRGDLSKMLSEVIYSYYKFVKGMFLVYIIVGILNSAGLLLLGVDHAILFGMTTAFMTVIPYIGIIVSSALPITVVWAETNSFWYPLGVVGIFTFVQYLEANVIFPYVVGKQIDLNTLVSLIAILLGGVVWGFSGMILFVPFLAFVKIIAGHFDELKPLQKLLEIPPRARKKVRLKK